MNELFFHVILDCGYFISYSVPKRFPMSSEEQHVRLYRATPVATLKRRGGTRSQFLDVF